MEEKKEYVFYTYLRYFWQRKLYFLIVPLITTLVLTAAVFFLTKNKPYQGTVQFYTGTLDSAELEDPDNVAAKFDETDINGLDVFVSEKGQVKFKLMGDTEQEVQEDIDAIVSEYGQDLQKAADVRVDVTEEYLSAVEERVRVLKASIEDYKAVLTKDQITISEAGLYKDLLLVAEQELSEQSQSAQKMDRDLALFEQPSLLSSSVTKEKAYLNLKESVAIGIVLGLILTVILLMLMKYIADARRYYKHD